MSVDVEREKEPTSCGGREEWDRTGWNGEGEGVGVSRVSYYDSDSVKTPTSRPLNEHH